MWLWLIQRKKNMFSSSLHSFFGLWYSIPLASQTRPFIGENNFQCESTSTRKKNLVDIIVKKRDNVHIYIYFVYFFIGLLMIEYKWDFRFFLVMTAATDLELMRRMRFCLAKELISERWQNLLRYRSIMSVKTMRGFIGVVLTFWSHQQETRKST